MDEQVLERLIRLLEEISPHVWGVAQRQAQIEAVWDTMWYVVFALATVLPWLKIDRIMQAVKRFDDEGTFILPVFVFLAGVTVITGVTSMFYLEDIVTFALNPEYSAIERLLELVVK